MIAKLLRTAALAVSILATPTGVDAQSTSASAKDAGEARGVLVGTIISEGSGVPVEGVLVTASGSKSPRFSKTDANGEFSMELVPGSYSVSLEHVQFNGRTQQAIEISPDKIHEITYTLRRSEKRSPPKVEEIVVTGQYVAGAIEQTRFSESVLDVLSAEDFRITGDSDVAGSLSRITGVTLRDGKFVYVRGLGERYSSTTFNNALLPSPDPSRRVVPLDLFPSGVMKQLSIQKSYAPYLPGDFSGGAIQLTTRDIPEEREASIKISVDGDTETTFQDHGWYEGGGSDRWGFDSGYRDIPGKVHELSQNGRLPFVLSNDELRDVGQSLNRVYDEGDEAIIPNFTLNGSFADRYDTPSLGSFGVLLGVRMKNEWDYTQQNRRTTELDLPTFNPKIADDLVYDETLNSINYAGLLSAEWNAEPHSIKSTLFYTRDTDNRYITEEGFTDENARIIRNTYFEWEERDLLTTQILGDHLFERVVGPLDVGFDWGTTYSISNRAKPDARFYQYEDEAENGRFTFAQEAGSNSRVWEELQDTAWDLYADLDLPLTLTDRVATTIKVGAKYFTKDRDSQNRNLRYRNAFSNFSSISRLDPTGVFADDNIGRGKWQLIEITQNTDGYQATEDLLAGYFQTDWELFDDWRLMAGFRWERSEQSTTTRAISGEPDMAELKKDFILPATTLTWQFTDAMQLRASYSQTFNRPDIREFSPAPYIDRNENKVFIGNPNLKIAEIMNYDLRWEWYYSSSDSLQLAFFHKELESPIEETLRLRGGSLLRTYENADAATISGLEVALRQTLEPLGEWARDFYVKFNGALIESEVDVAENAIQQTHKTRRLEGQSDWTLNSQLTWDNLPRDIQATVTFNMFGDRIDDVGVQCLGDAIERPVPLLGFIYRHGFELGGRKMRFGLKAENLLNPKRTIERPAAGDGTLNDLCAGARGNASGSVVEREFRDGRSFTLSLETSF